jgi:dehydrogenase/reductase SDR family protein 7B
LNNQIWWITGASSGIGAALAKALSNRGAKLILSGRNLDALNEVAYCLPTDALVLPFEATDYAALPEIVRKAQAWQGRIDGLVNNAGISQRSLAIDTDFSVYQRIVDVDLLAPIALTQQVLPDMLQQGGGQIIAISSVAGIAGVPLRSAYCAAKHGIIGYHDSLRAENEHLGLKVLVVAPGSVRTDVSRNALTADGSRRGESDAAIENGMSPDVAATGILAAVDAGTRELLLATGPEEQIAKLRRSDPNALFDHVSAMVQSGYAQKMKAEASR